MLLFDGILNIFSPALIRTVLFLPEHLVTLFKVAACPRRPLADTRVGPGPGRLTWSVDSVGRSTR